jgi:hypothetical protein
MPTTETHTWIVPHPLPHAGRAVSDLEDAELMALLRRVNSRAYGLRFRGLARACREELFRRVAPNAEGGQAR